MVARGNFQGLCAFVPGQSVLGWEVVGVFFTKERG